MAEEGDVVAVGMDDDDGALAVHRDEFICRTVEVGEDSIRPDAAGMEDEGRGVGSEDDPADQWDLPPEGGGVSADADVLSPDGSARSGRSSRGRRPARTVCGLLVFFASTRIIDYPTGK